MFLLFLFFISAINGQLTPTQLYEGNVALTVRDLGRSVAIKDTQIISGGHETSYGPQLWQFTRTGANTWSAGTKFAYPAGITTGLGSFNVYLVDDLLFVHVHNAANSGIVVYRWTTVWTYEAFLQPPSDNSQFFGIHSETIKYENGVVVIGNYGVSSFTGKAYIWENTAGTTWTYRGELNSPVSQDAGAEFGRSLCIDGDYIIVGENNKQVGSYIGQGEVHVYKRSVNTWPHVATINSDQTTTSYDYFGSNVACNGGRLLITEDKFGGALHYFQLISNTWTFRSTKYKSGINNRNGNYMKIEGTEASVSSGENSVLYMSLSGTTWNNVFEYIDAAQLTSRAYDIDFVNGRMVTGNRNYNTNGGVAEGVVYAYEGLSTTPPTPAPTNPTPAPTNPTTAPTTAAPSTNPTAAPTNSPTANPTTPPTETGTTNIAVAQVKFFVANDTERKQVINDFFTQLDIDFPTNPDYDVTKVIDSVESGLITVQLIQLVNNNTKLENAFKALRCGSSPELCVVTISYPDGGRRLLRDVDPRELSGVASIQIRFELSQELYNDLDGITLDNSTFEQALADALGVSNNEDVTITSTGGFVTVYGSLSAPSINDPLDTTLIDAANNLQTNMQIIIAALIDLIGSPTQGFVVGTTIDLCPSSRNCNNVGTCNPATGVCTCIGDYWGINCETPCTCVNGGYCRDAMCRCTYPWHGLRCDSVTDCGTCA